MYNVFALKLIDCSFSIDLI